MTVVSDTGPVNYLLFIGRERLLEELFSEVEIPAEVRKELAKPQGPLKSISRLCSLEGISIGTEDLRSSADSQELKRLDDGEREAILLAEKLEADFVLMDEKAGRSVARRRGLEPKGTLGVLDAAGREGFVNVPAAVEALRGTTFRASPNLYDWLLNRHR